MATHRLSFIDTLAPDTTGNVFWQPASILDTNDLYPTNPVLVFTDTATHDKANGRFVVPKNYVGSASLVLRYKTTLTSGNTLWTANYTSIANAETGDPAAAQETLNGTATAVPGTTNLLKDITIALTAGNFAADDTVLIQIGRNGAGADTAAGSLQLIDAFFDYADV
jgi:hypothetical protein